MKPRAHGLELVFFLMATLPIIYAAAYVRARLTHRLVWNGSHVQRAHAISDLGIGWSNTELFFAPASIVEELIRNNLP